jgi:hypothetical protein
MDTNPPADLNTLCGSDLLDQQVLVDRIEQNVTKDVYVREIMIRVDIDLDLRVRTVLLRKSHVKFSLQELRIKDYILCKQRQSDLCGNRNLQVDPFACEDMRGLSTNT